MLLDPVTPSGPGTPAAVDLDAFPVRRRYRPARDDVHGLAGDPDGTVVIGVPQGTGYAVVIDARPCTETFGRLAVALLDGPQLVLVPPGCLYGVQAVTDGVLVEVRSADRGSTRERWTADPDDPDLKIRWLRPRRTRTPGDDRSWAALCARLGAPAGPRRDRVTLW
nr:dTDP-4-dehydrorhamnose 3,5-epimerase family protein [Pseudonocardia sp. C8]